MTYCTYLQYQDMGGRMTEQEFNVWAERASRKIDALTLGRAARCAELLADELADACGQMADAMRGQADYRTSLASGIAGAANDGYSESYLTGAGGLAAGNSVLLRILSDALGSDPCGLLYKGVCGC